MRYPALNDLIKKADNKYSLVNATAKRAREIVEGDEPLVKIKIDNPDEFWKSSKFLVVLTD